MYERDEEGQEINLFGPDAMTETWQHVGLDYSAVGQFSLFVDGDGLNSQAKPRANSVAKLQFGVGFEGLIDEVRISNVSRARPWYQLQAALLSENPPDVIVGDLQDCR